MICGGSGRKFGLVGAFVGKYPLSCISFTLVLLAASVSGIYFRINFKLGLNDGFVAPDAPSRREIATQKSFFGGEGESWYLALFALTKRPDGNMLNSAEFNELNTFYTNITEKTNFTLKYTNGGNVTNITYRYIDICQPLCNINNQMQKLMENSWLASMKYPVSQVFSYDLNIGKHVFNRSYDSKTGELVGSNFMAFYFTVFVSTKLRKKQVDHFEKEVGRLTLEHNKNPKALVELLNHGSNSVFNEMEKGIQEWLFYLMIGHGSAILMFLGLNVFSSWWHGQFPLLRLLLALLSVILVSGALCSGVGMVAWAGYSVNLLFFTSPLFTLVFIINAYDSFHIADVWSRLQIESRRKQYTPSERLATTFEQIAPSYLTLNLSLMVAFFTAHLFLFTNYSAYSLAVAFALLFNFIYQTFIFSAALALLCSDSQQAYEADFAKSIELKKPSIGCFNVPAPTVTNGASKNGSSIAKTNSLSSIPMKRYKFQQACAHKIYYAYATFLSSTWTKIVALMLVLLIGWFGVKNGLTGLENRMDYRKLLPNGSPAIRAFNLMDTIWMDILQIVYIVKKPPNFENATEFREFKKFVADVSAIPQAMPPRAHMSWLFDYFRDQLEQNFFEIDSSKQSKAINMSNFKEFITTFPYKAWQSGVNYSFDEEKKIPKINSMVVLIAYNGTKGLNGKYKLMAQCRKVAASYPDFDILAFDTDSQTVDVIEAVPRTTLILVLCLIISTAVISQTLLWNIFATVLTTITVTSIIAGLYGLGRLLGLELDLLSVPATTAIAAQVIHLGSQYMGEFISCWAKEGRLRRALEFTSSPFWKTAVLWFIIAVPQLLSSVQFFSVQAHVLLLGIGLVACHVLVIVPMLVHSLPVKFISKN